MKKQKKIDVQLTIGSGISEESVQSLATNLYAKIPNLEGDLRKFTHGIVRWFQEGQLNPNSDGDYSKVNTLLRVLRNSPARDMYDENFVSELSGLPASFAEVQMVCSIDSDCGEYLSMGDHTYEVVPVSTFQEARKYLKFAPDWCILRSEEAFEEHSMDGTCRCYFCVRDDVQKVPTIPGEAYPYDDYGYSLIAVYVDADGKIVSVTSRWNFDGAGDNFLSEFQLKSLLGDKFGEL